MFRLSDLFYLPKSDRKALAVILTAALAALLVISYCGTDTAGTSADERTEQDSLLQTDGQMVAASRDTVTRYYAVPVEKAERFAFDPNTADSTQLLRLGLQPWQVRSIYKYRARGGVYRKKEDFARLYGLTVKQYRELEPYIRISRDYQPAADYVKASRESLPAGAHDKMSSSAAKADSLSAALREERHDNARPASSHKLQAGQTLRLDHADEAALQQIPGIGPYYAHRIVDYRERLGGFVNKQQLMEIDGFPEEALAYIETGHEAVKKLNVNTLSVTMLSRHPYISYYQAKAIADYRRLVGPISDISQLATHRDFSEQDIERLRPYLSY